MSKTNKALTGTWKLKVAESLTDNRVHGVDYDDSNWNETQIPSHWRTLPDFETADGPMIFRKRFEFTAKADKRQWIMFDGIFSTASIWIDGQYGGDAEGYFATHAIEMPASSRSAAHHVVTAEVSCPPLNVWHENSSNPGGIWRDVYVKETGDIRISRFRAMCVEASSANATVQIACELTSIHTKRVVARVNVYLEDELVTSTQVLRVIASGPNRLSWNVYIEEPDLWWPYELGDQPLYRFELEVLDDENPDEPSDSRSFTTGLRSISVDNWQTSVNGESLFIKGIQQHVVNLHPADAQLGSYENAINAAKDQHLNMLYLPLHIEHDAFYEAADRAGMLIWQGLPQSLSPDKTRKLRAGRLARQAVEKLSTHPSIAAWVRTAPRFNYVFGNTNSLNRTINVVDPSREVLKSPDVIESWNVTQLSRSLRAWPRSARLMAFASSDPSACMEYLRLLKYKPCCGAIAIINDIQDLKQSCKPVRLIVASNSVYIVNDARDPIFGAHVDVTGDGFKFAWEGDVLPDSTTLVATMPKHIPTQCVTRVQLRRPPWTTAHIVDEITFEH